MARHYDVSMLIKHGLVVPTAETAGKNRGAGRILNRLWLLDLGCKPPHRASRFVIRYRSLCSHRNSMFGLNPRCLINQTRTALASEIAPEPLVLYAAPILQLRQEHDVNKRPDEPRNNSCELDSA